METRNDPFQGEEKEENGQKDCNEEDGPIERGAAKLVDGKIKGIVGIQTFANRDNDALC